MKKEFTPADATIKNAVDYANWMLDLEMDWVVTQPHADMMTLTAVNVDDFCRVSAMAELEYVFKRTTQHVGRWVAGHLLLKLNPNLEENEAFVTVFKTKQGYVVMDVPEDESSCVIHLINA